MTDWEIPRDQYGRPMLYPPDSDTRVGYKRPSGIGKSIGNSDSLAPWQIHTALSGLVAQPVLYTLAQSMVADGKTWDTSAGEWKNLIRKAQVAGGSESKADRGTSIHNLCEAAETGWLDWDLVDESLVPLMVDYDRILSEFRFLAAEVFVAADIAVEVPNREPWVLRSAGSIDRICEWNGKRYVVDIKSGRDDEFRVGVCGQTFVYNRGMVYGDDVVSQDFPALDLQWERPADKNHWVPKSSYEPVNPSLRAPLNCEQAHTLMFHAGRDNVWRVYAIPMEKGEEIATVGDWASKASYVKKFERVL